MYFDESPSFLVAMRDVKGTVNLSRGKIFVRKPITMVLVGVALLCSSLQAADTYHLKTGDSTNLQRCKVTLDVNGELKLNPDGKKVTRAPIKVHGELVYDERLKVPSTLPNSITAMRSFDKAEADIRIGSKSEFKTNASWRIVA